MDMGKVITAFMSVLFVVQFVYSETTNTCKQNVFSIQKRLRLLGTSIKERTVGDKFLCVTLCSIEDSSCTCCNILEQENGQFLCKLFERDHCKLNEGYTIEDAKATLYSILTDENDPMINPAVPDSSIAETPSIMSSTVVTGMVATETHVSPSVTSLMPPLSSSVTGSTSYTPAGCRKLYLDGTTQDGAYILPGDSSNKVFCDMTGTSTGCGGGGWSLVLKMNGALTTFKYDSYRWALVDSIQPYSGKDLSTNSESRPKTYTTLAFTQMCLGMVINGETGWTVVDIAGSSLYDLITSDTHYPTNLSVDDWKKLIPSASGLQASLQANCPIQGINVERGGTGVRIGIIATETCGNTGDYNSRLGFAAMGTSCGQDGSNSCGNDAKCTQPAHSIKTWGFVLVK